VQGRAVPDLHSAHLFGANLVGANLGEAKLSGANLSWANLGKANLQRANLDEANLSWANLGGANLQWASWWTSDGADLDGASWWTFDGANLEGANLERANLERANLERANFKRAYLGGAKLGEANLVGANLDGADLEGANLERANLERANLERANLVGAYLVGADFHKAVLSRAVFGATDLREVKGLDTCQHHGPSTIDHRTIALSGPLPLAFLRGCGLPDLLIDYLPSLLNQPIQFYSCFISYSTKDQEFAERLHADLQDKGVRCWFAPHDIQGGKKIHEQIDEAIRLYDRLLLILSRDSMESEWVKTEISKARKREVREKRRMLFPVGLVDFERLRNWECFDADTGKDSAREIREYFIPDFSKWKDHDSYQEAFDRLLKDLKAEAGRADTATGRAD
jgi:uncharacterized protein YjbI with pentapeptide repeats